jgi:sorbitol-specific phosphotransferase system component IIC
VHQKSVLIREVTFGGIGLIRGVTSLEEDSLVVFYYLVHQKSVLIRGVTFENTTKLSSSRDVTPLIRPISPKVTPLIRTDF